MKKNKLLVVWLLLPCMVFAEITSTEIIQEVEQILDDGSWVPKFYLDVLESEDRDTMNRFVPNLENFTISIDDIDLDSYAINYLDFEKLPNNFFWYQVEPLRFEMLFIGSGYFSTGWNRINILDAVYTGNMLKFTCRLDTGNIYNYRYSLLDWSSIIERDEIFDMFLIFDGDYLDVYIDEVLPENLFYTFARMDDATDIECRNLMRTNTCDLANVTWPVYADGTSDYGNKTSYNHEVGNTYRATDNIRVRDAQGLTGKSLFVLPKDTSVRVIAHGASEVIDGISASWLQVEVAEDSKDTEGNNVAEGTTGWLFGGYVSMEKEAGYEIQIAEEEPMYGENASDNEETKETEPFFPLIPIIVVVGVLLLCGIIVVVKTKKKSTS